MAEAWLGLAFGGLMMLVSAVCLVGVLLTFLKVSRIRGWRTAPGVIVRNRIEKEVDFANDTYRNDIAYEYVVDGQRHRGHKVSPFFLNTDQPGRSARVAARYPLGSEVTVSFNPRKPADSLLEPGGLHWVGGLVGLVMSGGLFFGWTLMREALAQFR